MIRSGWNNNTLLRVKNVSKHDIGVTTTIGQQFNIEPNKITMLEIKDIVLIETNTDGKLFGAGKLVVLDENNNPVKMSDMGGYDGFGVFEKYLEDTEIAECLTMSTKKFEAWLDTVEDKTNLEAIYIVAQKMDLPSSKMAILKKKMPGKLWDIPNENQ